MNRSLSFKIILFLALLQGIFGLLRAYDWVKIGVDLFGQGLLLLPFVGTVAVMRGLFISIVALLYVLSVIGALLAKGWAWWTCLTAVVLNLLLILARLAHGVAHGAPVLEALAWSVIPVILLFYLFSAPKRNALTSAPCRMR
jgi:hypothetical protein